MNPTVTVVIPFYNCPYIAEALESVLSQSRRAFEIIVVDDGSTRHADLITPYLPHIHYLGKANGGTASALNHGIRHASGEYIAWLSSDDVFFTDKINNQLLFMLQTGALLTYTNFHFINEYSQLTTLNASPVFPDFRELYRCFLQGNPVNGCTVMMKKELLQRIGLFDENLPFTHDYDLWFRAIVAGYPPVMLNHSLTGYRRHEGMGTLRHYDSILAEAEATRQRYRGRVEGLLAAMGG